MSANKNTDSKTKIAEDRGDSGFISGPLDHWAGDPESEPEQGASKDVVLCDSGVVVSGEIDSGICDTLSECLSEVKLVDTTIPSSQTVRQEPFVCKISSPQEKPTVPLEHLVIFYQPDDDGDT